MRLAYGWACCSSTRGSCAEIAFGGSVSGTLGSLCSLDRKSAKKREGTHCAKTQPPRRMSLSHWDSRGMWGAELGKWLRDPW